MASKIRPNYLTLFAIKMKNKLPEKLVKNAIHNCIHDMKKHGAEYTGLPFVISFYKERIGNFWYAFVVITDEKLLTPPTQTFPVWTQDKNVKAIELGGDKLGEHFIHPEEAEKAALKARSTAAIQLSAIHKKIAR